MMRNRRYPILAIVAAVALSAASAFAGIAGQGLSNTAGNGSISFNVDPSVDSQYLSDQITNNVTLSEGAQVSSVEVVNGVAKISFVSSKPGVLVEAVIDDAVLAGLTGAGAGGGLAGGSTAALVGAGVLAAGGAAFGISEAVGGSDGGGDDQAPGTAAE